MSASDLPKAARRELEEAVHTLWANELDRRILLQLILSGEPVRYSELVRSVGEASKAKFQSSINRLLDQILIARRLEEAGSRYRSYFTATPRGRVLGETIHGLVKHMREMNGEVHEVFAHELAGTHRLKPLPA